MRLKITYFIFAGLLLLAFNKGLTQPSRPLKYDSALVKQVKPTQLQEQQVFGEVDLSFAKAAENNDPTAWDRFRDWFLNLIFGNASMESINNLQWAFIWILAICGVSLAVWLFRRSDFGSFLKRSSRQSEFNFADVDEDISGIDFHKKVLTAKNEKDYRAAVRWLYLQQLHHLNEKGRIVWQPYKTNMDYAYELTGSVQQQSFKNISRVYEYVWYGKYDINEQRFQELEKEFNQFGAQLNA